MFAAFVDRAPDGALVDDVRHAMVIPKLGGPAVTLWREDDETEAAFRARADAVTETAP